MARHGIRAKSNGDDFGAFHKKPDACCTGAVAS
jgi:hypothetical protein